MKNQHTKEQMRPSMGLSRRAVLKKAAAVAGIAAVGSVSACISPPPEPAANKQDANEQKKMWHAEYDVVIIGSGFAGTAAAIEARKKGASTLVVEKMPVFGGNSAINGGAFAVAGSPLQEQKGIKDSVDRMVEDMLKAGRGLNHRELLEVVARGTRSAYEFTLEHGVKYKDIVMQFGGHSIPRTIQTENFSGGGIIVPLNTAARKLGVFFKNRCKLIRILQDPSNNITGITVRENYRFPDETSGELRNIRVKKGLIVATGGFSNDLRFRMQQDPNMDANLDSTNQPGATAESLHALLRAGATPVQLDQIQLGPWASPDEKGFGMAPQFLQQAAFPYGILVDIRTGKRFVNEMADRKTRSDAILKNKDENGRPVYPVAFCTREGTSASPTLPSALKYGVAHEFDSVDDLAAFYKINVQGLKDQVSRYNQLVKDGVDTEFGKTFFKKIYLDKPPFFAARAWVKVHHCMGGVQIDTQARLIHMATGQPIPGLYAAGEITGGIHGATRLGSCAIADCLVMGRIAGRNAADRTV